MGGLKDQELHPVISKLPQECGADSLHGKPVLLASFKLRHGLPAQATGGRDSHGAGQGLLWAIPGNKAFAGSFRSLA